MSDLAKRLPFDHGSAKDFPGPGPGECPEGCMCEEKCLPAALASIEAVQASGAFEVIDLMGALSDAMKEKSA